MVLIAVLLIIYILVCYLFFSLICMKSMSDAFKNIDDNIEKTLLPYKKTYIDAYTWVNSMHPKELHIKSNDKLDLSALFIKNDKPKGIMILSHGYRSNVRRDLYASTKEYYKMGYSLLLINQRACESEGEYITFGVKESNDLNLWVNYIHKKYPKLKIILGGISLGASSSLMVNNKYVNAIIADSGYNNAYDEVKYVLKHYFHLPAWLFIGLINIYCIIGADFNLKKANTFDNLSKLKIPILFIHGYSDDFVLCQNSIDSYKYYKNKKDILIIKDANHGMGYLVDKKNYIKKIKDFLKNI